MTAGAAWYATDRSTFVNDDLQAVVGSLASAAAREGLHVESDQHEEWENSVGLLQSQLAERFREVEILRETLRAPDLADLRDVVLEYDFRRRGIRLDCVLLGDGIVAVVEFKRTTVAVFCDGDFWHGRDLAKRKQKLASGANAKYWQAKIERNVERDRANQRALESLGWTVLRVWETDVLRDPESCAATIVAVIGRAAR